jgi:hypothetical protein
MTAGQEGSRHETQDVCRSSHGIDAGLASLTGYAQGGTPLSPPIRRSGGRVTSRRLQVGSQVHITAETLDAVQLEGTIRLRPGKTVELVMPASHGSPALTGVACVRSWSIARLGNEGPTYEGRCVWE